MVAVLVVLGVLAAAGLHIEARSRLSHGWHRLLWRWHTGNSWHGKPVPEDVWVWPGPWFWRMSRPKRAGLRCGVTASVLGAAAAWVASPHVTAYALLALAFCGLVLSTAMSVRAVCTYRHRRRWVRPLHLRLAPMIGRPLSGPMGYITVPRDRLSVQVKLPQAFTASLTDRTEITRTTAETLGIEAPDVSWRLGGPAPLLTLTSSKPAPDRVLIGDVMPSIERARPDELVWGLGKQSAVVKSSLSADSPHFGLSMASGAGKSVTARAIAAQMLWHGAIVLILDIKMISHQWAKGLPNVAIVRRPHEIHAALLWLGREADRRNEVALAGADMDGNVRAVVGPRLLIICEELNATVARLRAYWRQVRERDDPVRSPALDALDAVSFMGRQVLMNLIYIGQRLSVKGVGGDGDARENIGVIAFGRYSASNWKMLAPDHAMPPASRKPGRIQVVSDRVQECQALFLPARDARELALAGTVTPLPSGMPGARVAPATNAALPAPEQGDVPETRTLPGRVTLKQAVDEGVVTRSLQAVRRASTRPGFPQHRGYDHLAKLYDAADLAAWDQGASDL